MRVVLLFVLFLFSLPFQAQAGSEDENLKIVASIRPLTLITKDLVGDLVEVETLVPSGASHHDYTMRISDRRRLDAAQLVIWMGPSMERFLERPLNSLDPKRVLALGQDTEADQHEHEHDHFPDLHQWLDPQQATLMAEAISARLQQLLPQHKAQLASRLQDTIAQYNALDREMRQTLETVKSVGFVVEHRGYDFLVEAYGLNQLGWISEHSEQPASVRHLYQLEQSIRQQSGAEKARCLFSERSHASQGVLNLAQQLGLTLRSLDILGDEADTYANLMQNLVRDMAGCLAAASESTQPDNF